MLASKGAECLLPACSLSVLRPGGELQKLGGVLTSAVELDPLQRGLRWYGVADLGGVVQLLPPILASALKSFESLT